MELIAILSESREHTDARKTFQCKPDCASVSVGLAGSTPKQLSLRRIPTAWLRLLAFARLAPVAIGHTM